MKCKEKGREETSMRQEGKSKAVAYYTLAFASARLRGILNKANIDKWHGREAWNIRESLIKKYRPAGIIATSEARRRLNDASMKKHEDPAVLFEQLAEI
jgi:hypothetical protein